MEFIQNLLYEFSGFFRPYLSQISTALVASMLVIYGDRINRAVKMLVKGSHFIVKTLVFVALCAFGYGMATVMLAPLVKTLLLNIGSLWMGLVVVASFFGVGLLAQLHNHQ